MDDDKTYLINGAQFAKVMGLTKSMVRDLRGRFDDFPKPVMREGPALFYLLEECRRWAVKHDRPWDESDLPWVVVKLGDNPPGGATSKIATIPVDRGPAADRRDTPSTVK